MSWTFNKKRLSELLTKALGSRNMSEYSLHTGVSLTYISELIKQERNNPPLPKTLKKLAEKAHGDVTYEDLMEAAGHISIREPSATFGNAVQAHTFPTNLIPVTRKVPILGSVPCGIPLDQYEDRLGEEFLPPDLPHGEYYYLYTSGDSMEPTISDGEKVLVQVTTDVVNGKVYAVRVDHESTLKRVFRYNGRIELVPDNPKYPRQIYSSKDIYIHGLVIQATRQIK